MKRTIITFGGYFEAFIEKLTDKEQQKVDYLLTLLRTQDRIPIKFIKIIREGVYELRIEYNSNIYRVFFVFDEDKVVVLFNGFQKKSQKTPSNEIEKAIKIKNEYYEYKRQQNK
ncbi:MAG: type II toxin-antitoxin system RelE/ParE family toxin [Paludibacter sp.]|nr:type II toxin-antitoxin system RelE/ParE family toxin [Paludibacter sp.]